MSGRLAAKLLLLYLGSILAASVVTVTVLIYLVHARETRAIGSQLKSDAALAAGSIGGEEVEKLLRSLVRPEQTTILLGRFETELRARHYSEADIHHLRIRSAYSSNDSLTPVLLLDSSQLAARRLLSDQLLDGVNRLPGATPSWDAINVFRSKTPYFVARSAVEAAVVAAPAEESEASIALMLETAKDGVPRATDPFLAAKVLWISAFAPVRAKDGSILGVLELSNQVDDVLAGQRAAVRDMVIEALATILLGALIGSLAVRPFSRRLAQLQGAIDSVRTGRLDIELPENSSDEVGALAAAFNAMARELREKDRMRAVLVQTMSREVAQEMLSGKPELEGAEREATVLFTDVRGFTALSEGMSAHNVIGLLNDYFEKMAPPVEKFGGVVDKFIGDGMLAMFGAPHRIENDALAAVRAAVAMREGLLALNTRRMADGKPPLEIGIGINTGSVVTGTLGSKDRRNFTVLGQTVNVASRLCSAAGAGQIVISQSTWLRVKSRVEARELPPLELKGITFKVQAFEVLELLEQSRG